MGMQGRNMIHQMDVSISTYKRTYHLEKEAFHFVAYDRHLSALLVLWSHQIGNEPHGPRLFEFPVFPQNGSGCVLTLLNEISPGRTMAN